MLPNVRPSDHGFVSRGEAAIRFRFFLAGMLFCAASGSLLLYPLPGIVFMYCLAAGVLCGLLFVTREFLAVIAGFIILKVSSTWIVDAAARDGAGATQWWQPLLLSSAIAMAAYFGIRGVRGLLQRQ
jgi:hypothetical protein